MSHQIKEGRINVIMTVNVMGKELALRGNGVKEKLGNRSLNQSQNLQAVHQKITIMMRRKINVDQINAQMTANVMGLESVVFMDGVLESRDNDLNNP